MERQALRAGGQEPGTRLAKAGAERDETDTHLLWALCA